MKDYVSVQLTKLDCQILAWVLPMVPAMRPGPVPMAASNIPLAEAMAHSAAKDWPAYRPKADVKIAKADAAFLGNLLIWMITEFPREILEQWGRDKMSAALVLGAQLIGASKGQRGRPAKPAGWKEYRMWNTLQMAKGEAGRTVLTRGQDPVSLTADILSVDRRTIERFMQKWEMSRNSTAALVFDEDQLTRKP